jgi:hypothetical protein
MCDDVGLERSIGVLRTVVFLDGNIDEPKGGWIAAGAAKAPMASVIRWLADSVKPLGYVASRTSRTFRARESGV